MDSVCNSFSSVKEKIYGFYHKDALTTAGGLISAVAAVDMAIWAIWQASHYVGPQAATNLSIYLAGSVMYALSAANILPGTSRLAGLSYLFYGVVAGGGRGNLFITAKIINKLFNFADSYFLSPVYTHILVPLAERVIVPFGKELARLGSFLLQGLFLPMNPLWYVVAALVVGIVLYKGVPLIHSYFKNGT